ncbi:CBS domain-containing protein [Saccharothrix syringae]|uniref:CBS domain-containing protein n=1 Tax=Saccharothrix syringae TaxID=103733 RepID=UPI00068D4454|nr:CBS domain-containing protein [Saccharothrix syringae]
MPLHVVNAYAYEPLAEWAMTSEQEARARSEELIGEALRSAPVVDGRRLVGVVTRRDMLRAVSRDDRALGAEVRRRPGRYADADRLAGEGLRVPAFARARVPEGFELTEEALHGAEFPGLQAMHDPPRPEAVDAVRRRRARPP